MLKRWFTRRVTLSSEVVSSCGSSQCQVPACGGANACQLDGAAVGPVRCMGVAGDGPEATRLKRMGICVGQVVEVLRVGEPMIVRAAGTQVGLSRRLAHQVTVESVGS